MPFIQQKDHDKRMTICRKCEYYHKATKSCGPLGVGRTIQYRGEDKELCGCIMPIKTRIKMSECPLGKWARLMNPEMIAAYIEARDKAKATNKLDPDSQRVIKELYETAYDTVWTPTNCSKCWQNLIKAVDQFVLETETDELRANLPD